MEVKTIRTLQELLPLGVASCDLTPEEIAKRSCLSVQRTGHGEVHGRPG